MTRTAHERFFTDPSQVAKQFGRAAPQYDQEAVLQQTVAARLVDRLQYMTLRPEFILDLGSGTGRSARALAAKYKRARLVEFDLAPEMLRRSRPAWWRRPFSRHAWACADAQQLPLAAAGVDLIFSSLMLQWCNAPDAVFAEAARVLRPGGLFLFATLGPDTLRELRESWGVADDTDAAVHVNAFMDMHDIGDGLVRAGLRDPVMDAEPFTLTYGDTNGLMRDLKQLGAQNANAGRRHTLTGKERMQRMASAYERHRQDGLLPATYEVVYGHAWGGEHARQRDAHTAVFPVSALRKRSEAGHGRNAQA